ncbi:MAG: hypothetical protein EBU31_14725, partial [Proteobacteria bacterium]|nr:hypothetical protein [Pseudomonadota bacterium]
MPRRIGSLAVRALMVFGIGGAIVTGIVVTGGWFMADRLLQDSRMSVLDASDGSVTSAADFDLLLLRLLLVAGGVLVLAACTTLFWLV